MATISDDEYFLALGKFVHNFSKVEAFVHLSFHRIAGVETLVGNAIKRGIRLSDLISVIKQLLVTRKFGAEHIEDANDIFNQLDHIATLRDKVIHRGADIQGDGTLLSHNGAVMKAIESFETLTFRVQDLKDATDDLYRMQYRVMLLGSSIPREVFAQKIFGPWLYKPIQPVFPSKPPREKPPRRSPQQQPSQK